MAYKDREKLSKYIQNWFTIEDKPCNEEVFIEEFLYFIGCKNIEDGITFDGDGSYLGKQITIRTGECFGDFEHPVELEIAYDRNHISVYTANHDGFWFPCFIQMDNHHSSFEAVKTALMNRLVTTFGLES